MVLNASAPLMKTAMAVLAETWPCFLPFGELVKLSRERLRLAGGVSESEGLDEQSLGQALLSVYASASGSLIELSLSPPPVARVAGERPRTTALARLQAQRQNRVTNLRHESVWLGEIERAIVKRLDGWNTRADLVAAIVQDCSAGVLQVEKDGVPLQSAGALADAVAEAVERQLPIIARNALLLQ
jgi:hypothetical protein